jgi:hypothetical protein
LGKTVAASNGAAAQAIGTKLTTSPATKSAKKGESRGNAPTAPAAPPPPPPPHPAPPAPTDREGLARVTYNHYNSFFPVDAAGKKRFLTYNVGSRDFCVQMPLDIPTWFHQMLFVETRLKATGIATRVVEERGFQISQTIGFSAQCRNCNTISRNSHANDTFFEMIDELTEDF